MAKRQFILDTGREKIAVEGHEHRNVAVKYLMKRRRSLLSTRDTQKVDRLYSELPDRIEVIGKKATKTYNVKWSREGVGDLVGARFVFSIEETSA